MRQIGRISESGVPGSPCTYVWRACPVLYIRVRRARARRAPRGGITTSSSGADLSMSSTESLSLASDIKPLCSLSLHVRRISDSVVGRPIELGAIEQGIRAARTSFSGLTLEGEPGIGKTRLLLAASEVAAAEGFV